MDGLHLRYGRPLLPAPARLWAGVLLACCLILVAVLGMLSAHQSTANRLDRAVDSPIITWLGGHQGLAGWLAYPGSLIPPVVLSAAIVVACLLTGRLNGALLAAAAVPAAVGLNDGLFKPLVHRTYLGVLSYPSGHTATMFALAATVAILLLIPPRPVRRLGVPGADPGGRVRAGRCGRCRRHRSALALLHRYRGRRRRGYWNGMPARAYPGPAGHRRPAAPGTL